jgi:hypothetical protein
MIFISIFNRYNKLEMGRASDGNLVPVELDLVPKAHPSSKSSTRNSLVPELVPRQKSSAKFSAWKFFLNYQKIIGKIRN